jgi:TolB protein
MDELRRNTFVTVLVAAVVAGAALAPEADAAFPGANGKIAFVSYRDGNGEIYAMNADGSGQTNLTNHQASDASPAWSPDGTRIAFASWRISPSNYEIFVMNADGSGVTRLTFNTWHDGEPAWSPDGSKIAFSSNGASAVAEIWVVNADGSGLTQLTDNTTFDYSPEWSPDGSKLAFQRYVSGGSPDIFVMNADGSGETQLTDDPAVDAAPSWSPDGSKIAFNSYRDGNWEIHIMNADGSGQTNVTQTASDESYPQWSPDGSKLSFNTDSAGNPDVWAMNADGTARTRLTVDAALDVSATWQPVPSADLALGISATPDLVRSGKPLTYVITVHNAGPSNAQGVVVTDTLPSGARFASVQASSGSCIAPAVGATGTLTCNLGFLANTKDATAQIVVKVVVKRTTLMNTASVTSLTPDPNPANDAATIATLVR